MRRLLTGFHPSLGIPLITTWSDDDAYTIAWSGFPSLFRDSSDHHIGLEELVELRLPVSIPL